MTAQQTITETLATFMATTALQAAAAERLGCSSCAACRGFRTWLVCHAVTPPTSVYLLRECPGVEA